LENPNLVDKFKDRRMATLSWSIIAFFVLFVVFTVIFGVAIAFTYVQKKRKAKK